MIVQDKAKAILFLSNNMEVTFAQKVICVFLGFAALGGLSYFSNGWVKGFVNYLKN